VSGGTEPLILNVGTRWTESLALLADRCASGEIASVSIGFWLGRPTSSVDTLGKRKTIAPTGTRATTPLLPSLLTMATKICLHV
jgi:hypothetical protein